MKLNFTRPRKKASYFQLYLSNPLLQINLPCLCNASLVACVFECPFHYLFLLPPRPLARPPTVVWQISSAVRKQDYRSRNTEIFISSFLAYPAFLPPFIYPDRHEQYTSRSKPSALFATFPWLALRPASANKLYLSFRLS